MEWPFTQRKHQTHPVHRCAERNYRQCLYFKVWRAVRRRAWARVLFRFSGSTVLQIYGRWWFGGNHQTLGSNRWLGHYREYVVHLGRMHKHSVVVQSRSEYWRVVYVSLACFCAERRIIIWPFISSPKLIFKKLSKCNMISVNFLLE